MNQVGHDSIKSGPKALAKTCEIECVKKARETFFLRLVIIHSLPFSA